MDIIKKQIEKITSLEIQGATNIAKYAAEILKEYVERNKKLLDIELFCKIKEVEQLMYKARDTEPAMCNGLKYIINKLDEEMRTKRNKQLNKLVSQFADEYLELLAIAKQKITQIGANRIPMKEEKINIMTHCHSSLTTGILIEAKRLGKNFRVFCTETRPRFQGYITAKELINAGIETTLIVDSAMRWALRNYEISFILIGADAITSEGTILNKIGSRLLALAASEMHIPYYVATTLLKFDPDTKFGNLEKIDMRGYQEVWEDKPKELRILNPAFETISSRLIAGLITEAGIIPATNASIVFSQIYPYITSELLMKNGCIDFTLK